ncbi:DEXDc helicase [Bodo saltans virus]|uniref:DEXDc helicase n=1 Tax=Bodo saltans virus TaxID=2024608 RepID=A0A2H4UTW8_9VIRU|nr:DEXDc helicase [Bodo saltans virus]ATZ80338.1 DEXDc helicase [Bodo saltans virus]
MVIYENIPMKSKNVNVENIICEINHFCELYDKMKNKTEKEKGDTFELITKYLFLMHPSYCINTKNIWLYDEVPFDKQQKFKLPPKDKGIDLLLETKDNQIYAIQCKYRSKVNNSVNWTELSTFAGQLFVNNIDKAIFVTNTYDINEEIHKCNKIECIYGDFFKDLDKQFFDNVRNYVKGKELKYTSKILFDYQQEAVNDTIEHFKSNDRGYLSMACGTGKTKTTQYIDKIMNNILTLILVPSLYLLSQIYKEWSIENFGEKIKYILIGSDLENDDNYEKIPFLSTNETEITEQLKNIDGKTIIISTYQSCERLKTGLKNKEIDLIVFDEAHRTVGESKYSCAIFNENIKAKKRLFVTATPKIYTKVDDCDTDDGVISMDNDKLYGKMIYEYQIGQAIDDKRLTPYEIHMLYISDEQIKKYIGKNVTVDGTTYNFHYIATAMLIDKMIWNNQINHLFTYHASVKNSKNFANLLNDITYLIEMNHIDGSMNAKKKRDLISTFEEKKRAILTSVRVLNEGVNIPIADSVCFVEGRTNGIDIIQCIGRILRLYKGKEKAKIIIPILEENVKNSKFDDLMRVIKNLNNYDYHVKETIMDKKDDIKKLIKIGKYNCDDGITENIKLNISELKKTISSVIVDKCYGWYNMLNKLVDFFEKNKRRPYDKPKEPNEKKLSRWIYYQKINYTKREYIMKDEVIRKKWKEMCKKYEKYMMNYDEIWYNNYYALIKFFETNKKRPHDKSKDINEKKLGHWIGTQKRNYAKHKNALKNEEKWNKWKELCEKYDEYLMNDDEIWNYIYSELIKFFEINKNYPNIYSKDNNEKKLAKWLCHQKENYKKQQKSMKNNTKRKTWEELCEKYKEYMMDYNELWYNTYDELIKYFETNKKQPSSASKDTNVKRLGVWLLKQKYNYAKQERAMKDKTKRKKFEELYEKYM